MSNCKDLCLLLVAVLVPDHAGKVFRRRQRGLIKRTVLHETCPNSQYRIDRQGRISACGRDRQSYFLIYPFLRELLYLLRDLFFSSILIHKMSFDPLRVDYVALVQLSVVF